MSRFMVTVLALFLGFGLTIKLQANDPNDQVVETQSMVTLALTKFEVNEASLDVHLRFENHSDHDVWVLHSLITGHHLPLEVFLSKNGQTLLIRRRLDVPSKWNFESPKRGRYDLLRSGESWTDRQSIPLPVVPIFEFAQSDASKIFTGNVRNVRLEMGYYDQDLPALMRDVLSEAEKFEGTFMAPDSVKLEYFRGLKARDRGLGRYTVLNPDPYDTGSVVVPYTYQNFTGEKVLSICVNGVSIPYDGFVEEQPQPQVALP